MDANESDSLIHYGIPGMKWGVRRYQNKDGTLTSAGKKRYENNGEKFASSSSQKERSRLTDAELRQRIQRLEMETKLKDLEKRNLDAGREYAESILKDVGRRVIVTAATGAVLYGVQTAVSGKFDAGLLASAIFNGGAKKK